MARHGENIRKRKDGRWEARLLVKCNQSATTHYRYFYGKSYKEAKEKRMHYQNTLPKIPIEKEQTKKILFHQLLDEWLTFVYPDIKASTYAKYAFNIERHIAPELGSFPLYALTTDVLDSFSRNKLMEGRLTSKGGLAPKTVNSLMSIIKLALAYGNEHGYTIPRQLSIHNVRQTVPPICVLTIPEQKRLESFLMNDLNNLKLGILISLYAGLRIGEICGLQWGDIHFDSNTLSICRTIMRIQDKSQDANARTKLIIDRPKTEASIRTIPLPEFLMDILKKHQKAPKFYMVSGKQMPLEPRCFYASYKRIMNQVGLEEYNYHSLRHTFATRCVELNFDIKSLSEILGHADVNITLRRYVHPSMELKRQQMERLGMGFCGQNSGQFKGNAL